tara:strand:+ start:2047 stop:2346 length:300 start_codon:yes stop_codon:yes gene_type:complete
MGSVLIEQFSKGQDFAVGIKVFLSLTPEQRAVVEERVDDVLEHRQRFLNYEYPNDVDKNIFGNLLESTQKLIRSLGLENKVGMSPPYRVNVPRKNYRQA